MRKFLVVLLVALFWFCNISESQMVRPVVVGEKDPRVGTITGLPKGDGAGGISLATPGSDYLVSVEQDETPSLGGDLDLDGNNILGFGTSIQIPIGYAGSEISTGCKRLIEIPFDCTIQSVSLFADQSGDLVLDIWVDAIANSPPTVADTITAAAKPTLDAADTYQDATLTGWTTSLTAGSILAINVDSAATVTGATLSIWVTNE